MTIKRNRIKQVAHIINSNEVHSQEELLNLLNNNGLNTTQATLSRDLKELKASKIPDGKGSYIYALSTKEFSRISGGLGNEIKSIEFAGNFGILKTISGFASPVAVLIDSKNLPCVAGTISGDDTVFVVIRDNFTRDDLIELLKFDFPDINNKYTK